MIEVSVHGEEEKFFVEVSPKGTLSGGSFSLDLRLPAGTSLQRTVERGCSKRAKFSSPDMRRIFPEVGA